MATWTVNNPDGSYTRLKPLRVNYPCKACRKSTSVMVLVRVDASPLFGKPIPRRTYHESYYRPDGSSIGRYMRGMDCPHCGLKSLAPREVKGTVNRDKPCNTKCLSSKGHLCECACGGLNHGAGWS